jgi:hypothetical protein
VPQIERETKIIKGKRKELRVDAFLSLLLKYENREHPSDLAWQDRLILNFKN